MMPRRERFVLEYLTDLNSTQAAIRAGYSQKNADVEGPRLLGNAGVAAAIAAAQAERAKRLEITADRVLQEYARIAFANMVDYVEFGADGVTIKNMDGLTPDQTAAIVEVSQTTTQSGGSIRFKLHDKLAALAAISKHLGLNAPEKVAMTDSNGADLKDQDPVALARGIAFIFARAAISRPGECGMTCSKPIL